MADNKDKNKDAKSGEPVQLDKEQAQPREGSQQGKQQPFEGGQRK